MPLSENYLAGLQRHLQHFAALLETCPNPGLDTPSGEPSAVQGITAVDFIPGLVVLSALINHPDWTISCGEDTEEASKENTVEAPDEKRKATKDTGVWTTVLDLSDPASGGSVFRLIASRHCPDAVPVLTYQSAPYDVGEPVELVGKTNFNRGALTWWLMAYVDRLLTYQRAYTRADIADDLRLEFALRAASRAQQMNTIMRGLLRTKNPEFGRWLGVFERSSYIQPLVNRVRERSETAEIAYAMATANKEAARSRLDALAKTLSQVEVADGVMYWTFAGETMLETDDCL